LEDALNEGLGPGWRTAVGDRPRFTRRHRLSRTLWPFPWLNRPRALEKVSNISYGDAGIQNLLDVYRHRGHPSRAPTLVYMHGGGYFSGRKGREALPLIHRLASHGWVCISANYRLRPGANFPDHLVDLKKVIAWTREHSDGYGFFVAQGASDTYSPRFLEIARSFVQELRSTSSQPVVYAELPGGQHAFDLFHSARFEAVVDGIEAFAAWVRTREPSAVASP
jgi:acetyl esterase/lipase